MATTTTSKTSKSGKRKLATSMPGEPSISSRLKHLRRAAGLSQEAIGAQGFISTPGWIKVENGQRAPSEKLLVAFCGLLIGEKIIRANQKEAMLIELCTLKYAGHRNPFLQQLARNHLETIVPVTLSK